MSSGSGNISSVINFGGVALSSGVAYGTCPQINIPTALLSTVVTLISGNPSSGGTGNFYGFYSASSPASQAQYQVPSGKTCYVLGFYLTAGNGNSYLQYGYGTAALVSEGTGTAPTGVIYYSATSTTTTSPFGNVAGTPPAQTFWPVPMSFPALSYPWSKVNAATSLYTTMICIVQ